MKCMECGDQILQTFANMRHFRVQWEGSKEQRDRAVPAMMQADLCSFPCLARWAANRNAELAVNA